ncbi:MAG: hypothetical protein AABY83_05780 [Pseudomonadota bacterium]
MQKSLLSRVLWSLTATALVVLNGCAQPSSVRTSASGPHSTAATHAPAAEQRPRPQTPAAIPAATALASLAIEDKRAGYFVNNTRFVDNSGEVLDMCRFSDTGYVTYTLGDSDVIMRKPSYAVKMRNMAQAGSSAIKLGTLVREPGTQWIFKANDGKQIEADWYRLQSQGLVLVRNRNQVNFVGLDGVVRNYPLPPGFVVSSYQEWDVSATRRLLLVNTSQQAQKGRGEIEIGLLDIDSGKIGTLLGFAVRDKSETDQMQYVRSVFSLVNTGSGPIAVAVEDEERRVVVRGLKSGIQAVAFDKAGAPWRIHTGLEHGKGWLSAQQGQAEKRIADLEAFLANQVPAQAAN